MSVFPRIFGRNGGQKVVVRAVDVVTWSRKFSPSKVVHAVVQLLLDGLMVGLMVELMVELMVDVERNV